MSERTLARWNAIVAAQPPTEEQLIVRICQKLLDAGCTNPPTELSCRTALTSELTKADASDCRKELRRYSSARTGQP